MTACLAVKGGKNCWSCGSFHSPIAEKISAYLAAVEEHGVLPMFYLELTSGIRWGNLMALLWDDLDLEAQLLTISKSARRINGEVKEAQPKTGNSVRTTFLPMVFLWGVRRRHQRNR